MSFIVIEKKKGLGILEISPSVTALTIEMLDEFKAGFRELANDSEVKLIILYAPSAIYGMNIGYIHEAMKARDREKTEDFLCDIHDFIFMEMYCCPKPILGAVLGTHLLGGGLEIFLPCDYVMTAPHTMFALPECGLGIMPGFGGTAISRLVGVRKAAEMIASAKIYSAEEALKIGLVDRIITDVNSPIKEIKAFAHEILDRTVLPKMEVHLAPEEADFTEEELVRYAKGKSRFAVTNALIAIREGAKCGIENLGPFWEERERFLNVLFTPNALEGVEAYLAKRKPKFTDTIGG